MKYSILFQIKRILFYSGRRKTYIPMMNKLMNTTVIGANMGFGKLPHPSCGSIHWGCQDLLRRGIWIHWWKTELDHNRLQSSNWCQEKYCTCCIGFSVIKTVYLVEKWKDLVMVVYNVQPVLFQCLAKKKKLNEILI